MQELGLFDDLALGYDNFNIILLLGSRERLLKLFQDIGDIAPTGDSIVGSIKLVCRTQLSGSDESWLKNKGGAACGLNNEAIHSQRARRHFRNQDLLTVKSCGISSGKFGL